MNIGLIIEESTASRCKRSPMLLGHNSAHANWSNCPKDF